MPAVEGEDVGALEEGAVDTGAPEFVVEGEDVGAFEEGARDIGEPVVVTFAPLTRTFARKNAYKIKLEKDRIFVKLHSTANSTVS